MKLAYLPVFCSDTPRVTNLTQPWLFKLATHAAGFFFDMSGQRELMEFVSVRRTHPGGWRPYFSGE